MRAPLSWLREYVTVGRFLVGRVLDVGAHPNADRLRVCQVDMGEGDARQIVCGAWNFEAGATVAVALPGAYLPIRDQVLDGTPTVNRVDLLSMVGIAREIAALFDQELRLPEVEDPAVVDREEVD